MTQNILQQYDLHYLLTISLITETGNEFSLVYELNWTIEKHIFIVIIG